MQLFYNCYQQVITVILGGDKMKERLEVLKKMKEELKLYKEYLLRIKFNNEMRQKEKPKTLIKKI